MMGDLLEDRIIEAHERRKNEAYWKERNGMSCRLEDEFKGQVYPRSCPTCGLGGRCTKGYTQIKNEGKPGYSIQSPSGQINYYNVHGKVTESVGAIGVTGASFPPQPEPIPDGVYWHDWNFYHTATNTGMGKEFFREWQHRAKEFPGKPAHVVNAGVEQRVRVIATDRRLTLIGWLVNKMPNKYTIRELDELVDEIAAILLD